MWSHRAEAGRSGHAYCWFTRFSQVFIEGILLVVCAMQLPIALPRSLSLSLSLCVFPSLFFIPSLSLSPALSACSINIVNKFQFNGFFFVQLELMPPFLTLPPLDLCVCVCVIYLYYRHICVCLFACVCVCASVLFIIYISVYVYLYKIAFCSPA